MQQKDVIYIDVEDDITAIIGKVKDCKEKIVALVPPKRIGILQSAVNLRLLARAADTADKRLVIITGNAALSGLAASAKIPVAKNLQSRPELAEIPALAVDDDDVIDGEQLPIGDHADSSDAKVIVPPSSVDGIDIDGDVTPTRAAVAGSAPKKDRKGIKVPDFGSFRKKMLFFGIGGVLLILFLVWAIVFAPHATVVITAKTSDQAINNPVTLGDNQTTDSDKTTLKSVTKTEKVTQSVDFTATGKKDVGDKATGTVTFSTSSIGDLGTTIPANTQLTASNGMAYVTNQSVTISISNYMGATAGITAADSGSNYNGASGNASGAPGSIKANITVATTGGTDKTVTVVQQSDIDAAKQKLTDQAAADTKKKLIADLGGGMITIDSSFTTSAGDATSAPTVGQEATAAAKLTRIDTYTMTAVSKDDVNTYLDAALKKTLTNANQQRVYDNGSGTLKLTDFAPGDNNTYSANLSATGQVGPKIDDDQIKDEVKGKRFGEIEADLKAVDGISDVNVNLSPFWVQGVPNDTKKISIEFKLIKNG